MSVEFYSILAALAGNRIRSLPCLESKQISGRRRENG